MVYLGGFVSTFPHWITACHVVCVTLSVSVVIRKGLHRGLARMTSAGAMPPSPPDRSISQDSQDSMEDYWSEVRNIEEDSQGLLEEMMEKGSIDGECRPFYST